MIDTMFGWALVLFAPLVFAYAAASDLFNMRISNRIALIFLLPFPVFAYGIGMGGIEALWHVGISILTLVICYILWMKGAIGGGDAKFSAVAALWMGPQLSLLFFAIAAVYGAVMAIAFLFFRARMLPLFMLRMDWVHRLHSVKRIPYGVALGGAGLQLYAVSDWMQTGVLMAIN